MRIIDAHVHLLPDEIIERMRVWLQRRLGRTIPSLMDAPSAYTLLREMGAEYVFNLSHAVETSQVIPLNRWQRELKRKYGEIVTFGAFHPESDVAMLPDLFRKFNLDGLKLHPGVQRFHPDSERALEIYEVLEELGKPLVIHMGHFLDNGYEYTHPRYFERLVEAYSFPVILAHMGYEHFEYVEKYLDSRDNVYTDCSLVFIQEELPSSVLGRKVRYFPPPKEVFEAFQNRIMYGSETPITWWSPRRTVENIMRLDVDEAVKRKILYDNAKRFMERHCDS